MMNIKPSINEIYKTVIDLEGPKYPLDDMSALNDAALYILNKLKSYGIKTQFQEFYVKGFDEPFKNIVGYIGDHSKPTIVLGSHYDTVRDCPGANDNLSAVAVSIEVARVLSGLENPPTVTIAVFTLEEKHPGLNKALEDALITNGYHDNEHRFINPNMLKFNKHVKALAFPKIRSLVQDNLIFKEILKETKGSITDDETKYLNILFDIYSEFESEFTKGNLTYSLGSQEFVR
ncbi:MAG: M28 family peptidase, partial [Candidatus Izemoplasma sp.]